MPDPVRITDVAPRDGLQNEPGVIPTPDKARLVRLLCATGVDEVEVTSFVSPRWIPQLGDASELLRLLQQPDPAAPPPASPPPIFSALVPNLQGFQSLLDANTRAGFPLIAKVSVFTAASETFARRNTNASIAETLERFRPVIASAREHGLHVRGYVSCIVACPFEGPIAPEAVADVSRRLVDLGITELDLGDTIGAGTPETIARVLSAIDPIAPLAAPALPITLHLHDTRGRAPDCVRTALDMGIRSFDASVAGIGGCPYASTPGNRAPGNIATHTLINAIHDAGHHTRVNLDRLDKAARFALQIVSDARIRAAAASPTPEAGA